MGAPHLSLAPFSVHIGDDVLADLRARIRNTRWPDPAPGPAWSQGMDLNYLRGLLDYWAEGYDWRATERRLNAHPQFMADIDGARVHFVHQRSAGGGVPLILTHGWPSTYAELLPLVSRLTDPSARGIDGPAFDLVVPSLPGYGFSPRPGRIGVNYRYVAALWHRLMRGLGYERYGAVGGDFGAGVTTYMALDDPAPMLGIYLYTPEIDPYFGPASPPRTEAEQTFLDQRRRWAETERGYAQIQSTKPQTLGYGLNDSPAGLAAWVLEKWRSWADTGGDLDRRFSRDDLLTTVMIYWVSGSITSSMRDYFDNRWHGEPLGPNAYVRVPTGVAAFAKHFVEEGDPPREWFERLYDVRRWSRMPRGGHFGPAEEPDLLARDIAAFFAALT
jgi:pimeloyl-ACP methyl ester carboxylesterase